MKNFQRINDYLLITTRSQKKGNKTISQKEMEGDGLASVIGLLERSGVLTLEDILEDRITEECLSLFNVDGSLRHTAKHKLLDHLNLQPIADKPAIYYSLIDMSMIFRLATHQHQRTERKRNVMALLTNG